MPQSEYSAVAKVPLSFAWEQFLHKVYHPEKFVGATDVKIHEDGPGNRCIREMTLTPAPDKSMKVLEEITWDEATYIVDFRILEHPSHTGNVINKLDVKKNDKGEDEVWVTFRMDWAFKGEGPDPVQLKIQGAVDKSISVMESAYAEKQQ